MNSAQQSHAAASNGSQHGIAFKSPVQQKGMGGEEEFTEQPISNYISANGHDVSPFNPSAVPVQRKQHIPDKPKRLSLQLKTGQMYDDAVSAAAISQTMPVAQLVKLSNNVETDTCSFEELEEMVNSGDLNMDDIAIVEKVMDKMKGGSPASVNFKTAEVEDDAWSDHEFFNFNTIPCKEYQEQIVGGYFYRFYNDAYRCIEFSQEKDKNVSGIITKATPVKIEKQVNIKGVGGKIKGIASQDLKQPKKKNYYHFKAANMEAGLGTAGTSPDGKTWHHHATEGQMELLDRDVHAAFKHAGGKKYWGSV